MQIGVVDYGASNIFSVLRAVSHLGAKAKVISKQEDLKSNIEMPPQRDIRDSQPTISVNYRVIKNTEENNYERDKNYSSYSDRSDDWDNNEDNDW